MSDKLYGATTLRFLCFSCFLLTLTFKQDLCCFFDIRECSFTIKPFLKNPANSLTNLCCLCAHVRTPFVWSQSICFANSFTVAACCLWGVVSQANYSATHISLATSRPLCHWKASAVRKPQHSSRAKRLSVCLSLPPTSSVFCSLSILSSPIPLPHSLFPFLCPTSLLQDNNNMTLSLFLASNHLIVYILTFVCCISPFFCDSVACSAYA